MMKRTIRVVESVRDGVPKGEKAFLEIARLNRVDRYDKGLNGSRGGAVEISLTISSRSVSWEGSTTK